MINFPMSLPDDNLAVSTMGLSKRYKTNVALENVSLQIPTGAVYLLVGENGAGKSTFIKILLDLVQSDGGTAQVFGLNPVHDGPTVRANIGYVPEYSEWGYGWMKVGALIESHAGYFPTWDSEYANRIVETFQIRRDKKMQELSKGQARRVHLLLALAHKPPLLLLDEPTDGLDPLMRDTMMEVLIEHIADTPTTMLISTHHIEEFEKLADHIGILRLGQLKAQASLQYFHKNLNRYRIEVPEGWSGTTKLNSSLLHRVDSARETQITVWGSENEVRDLLAASNAVVRDVSPMSLSDAALTFLKLNG